MTYISIQDPTESDYEGECRMCGEPMEQDGYCSQICFEAMLR